MNTPTLARTLLIITVGAAIAAIGHSAAPTSEGAVAPADHSPDKKARAPYPSAPPNMSPEQAKIWNSPTMLRARAWVQEYCQRSAKITPEEANEYMAEMERMSPVQMKLWLLKFDEEEDRMRQQQADFETTRQAAVGRGMSIDHATQQSYANINRDESEAAQNAEQSVNETKEASEERLLQKSSDRDAAATALSTRPVFSGYGLYGGYSPYGAFGSGGIHYHVHYHR
jgi:hypothetical protein